MRLSFILFLHVFLVAGFIVSNDGFDKTLSYAFATAMKVVCTFSNVDTNEWDDATLRAFMWLRLFFIGSFLPFAASRVWKNMELALGGLPKRLPIHVDACKRKV